MTQYITALLMTSLLMTVVILVLILFNKLLSDKYPAKWRYYIWLIVIVGLLIPFRPNIGLPTQFPAYSTMQSDTGNELSYSSDESADTQTATAKVESSKNIWPSAGVLFVIWLTGVVCILAFRLWQHKRFTGAVKRWSVDVESESTLALLKQVQTELDIPEKQIYIKTCKSITSPMLLGFMKPTILLPEKPIHEDELPLIVRHELLHYLHWDLWVKSLVMLTTAIHWFNPVMYLMSNEIQSDCEAFCDEALLGNSDLENRRLYGEAIIGVIGIKSVKRTVFSTYFYEGKNMMKKRLGSIMSMEKKRIGIAILCVTLVLAGTTVAGTAFGATSTLAADSAEISADQAKEIALAKTGGGDVTEIKLNYEKKGRKVYEIEIVNGNIKYDMDIGVTDSQIYDYEEEIIKTSETQGSASNSNQGNVSTETQSSDPEITVEKAQEIALAKTGGGTVIECNLDYENGRKVYDIKIINGDTKYCMDVGVLDSQIYDYETETIYSTSPSTQAPSTYLYGYDDDDNDDDNDNDDDYDDNDYDDNDNDDDDDD